METASYQRVMERMASLAGLDPELVDDLTWRQWRNLADFRLGSWLWPAAEWPDLRVDVQAAVSEETDDQGVVVRRLAAVPSDTAAVLAVHDRHPDDPRAQELEFRLVEENGAKQAALLGQTDGLTSVWLTCRRSAPSLFGDPYNGDRAYAAGDQVFYETDFYNCAAAAGVNESPQAYPAKWSRVEIPKRFAEALARGVIADWPANEDAAMADKAEDALLRLLLELENDQQQNGRMRVAVNQ